MILFLSLWRLAISGESITRNEMQMDPVKTSVSTASSVTIDNLYRLKTYLISKGVSSDTANKFYKKMSFSSSMNTVVHELNMKDWTLDQKELQKKLKSNNLGDIIKLVKQALSRETIRKSSVITVKKQNGKYAVTVTAITGSTSSYATETKKTWGNFLWWRINEKSNTYKRSLTGQEIEKINSAIQAKVYPILQKYAK